MKEKEVFLKALEKRNSEIRRLVATMSKAAVARKFGISRERVRQIVQASNGK